MRTQEHCGHRKRYNSAFRKKKQVPFMTNLPRRPRMIPERLARSPIFGIQELVDVDETA